MRFIQSIPLALPAVLFCLAPACANEIHFTELVADPQSDHNESSGGNGSLFDLVPGTGSITSSDEWVELYNAGSDPIDLTGFSILFADTTPSSYVFGTTTSGTLLFSGTSAIDSFAPGDFLVLGNPPGAINNAVTLELRDSNDFLLELWEVDDANASDSADEAVARSLLGDEEIRAAISPLANAAYFVDMAGAPGDGSTTTGGLSGTIPDAAAEPVPEPSTVFLLGLTAAGWFAARLRRARRGSSRTGSCTRRRGSVPA